MTSRGNILQSLYANGETSYLLPEYEFNDIVMLVI